MLKKSLLCTIIVLLAVSFIFADNLKLGEGEILLEPSSKPAIMKTLNGDPTNPFGRVLDTLYYDDGSPSWIYQGSSNALWYAVRFTPDQPCTVKAGLFMVYHISGVNPICTLFVWDDNAGTPGSAVDGPVAVSTTCYPNWDRGDFTGGYYDTNDFWFGYWLPWWSPGDSARACADASPDAGERQALGVRSGGGWSWNVNPGLLGDLLVRAVVEYGAAGDPDIDCSPNPLNVSGKDLYGSLQYTYRSYSFKIDKELQEKIENASPDEFFPVIVEFDKLINSDYFYNCVKDMGKSERRSFTINTLKHFTTSYQKNVMEYLEGMEKVGKVKRISQLWLTNSIGMQATKSVIEKIAQHPTIALVWLDDKLSQPFVAGGENIGMSNSIDSRAVVWNITKINADQVWPLGYTGQNVIVGHLDTGVNYNHHDLMDHLWDGGSSYPNHGWDFVSNDNDPMDENGHGTHTAGTIAGDGTAGTQTGVAPDAQVMCLRVVPAALTEFQDAVNFALSRNADVLSFSAGWDSAAAGGSWGYLSTQTRYVMNNCLTAGAVFSTSAGNGKQPGHYTIPYDIGIPANVPAPWYGAEGHSGCMAVGATNQSNTIASFSSLGATAWWFSPWYEYSYPPGLIKPDVSAPGGSPGITSLNYANVTGYVGGWAWQGTSMACPHLTGTIALMLSKNPTLTPKKVDSLIELTCLDLGSTGRDNTFGAGLLNALDAVNAVPISGVAEEPEITITSVTTSVKCFPNPTRNSTLIRFTLPKKAEISINIYDATGRKVSTLVKGEFEGGIHNVMWNRKNNQDVSVPQGVYFIRLKSEGMEAKEKLILID